MVHSHHKSIDFQEFESFKGTPYGQNANYAADFNDNIRVVENYKNIRDLI
ncbi:MAG: hypothetical protein WCF23_13005 [Candidatus Nitrosopolaris sp.]